LIGLGQSLGYAFVNYERPEDARKALISMNGLRIQNKTLKVCVDNVNAFNRMEGCLKAFFLFLR